MDSVINAAFTEETESLCPVCLQPCAARIERDGARIWKQTVCPNHGGNRALIASDADEYLRLRQYVAPRVSGGCCGSGSTCGADAGPPVCVLLLEITLACNLACPTCYADAHGHDFMPLTEVRRRLELFFKRTASLDVLMLSGGEPTIHPEFAAILAMALEYPVGRVLVNTNGLLLARGHPVLDQLASHKDRVELFLSYAGPSAAAHVALYGRDLRSEKEDALRRAKDADLWTTLVQTAAFGVNDQDVGSVFRSAMAWPNVSGVNYQPVMTAGRHRGPHSPLERLTLTDVLSLLEAQTGGALRSSDFVGLPCSHPDCCAITYGLLNAARTTIVPLPRHLDVARYLDLFADRISLAGILGSAARRVWHDLANLHGRQTIHDLARLYRAAGVREVIPLIGRPAEMGRRLMRVVVKPFMDRHTYDSQRIKQCCTRILTETGEAVSFCEYNVLRRMRPIPEGAIRLEPADRREPGAPQSERALTGGTTT